MATAGASNCRLGWLVGVPGAHEVAPGPATADAAAARYAALERLGALHEKGVLTDTEFAREKTALLGP